MPPPRGLAERPAEDAVRAWCLWQLDLAGAAAARLAAGDDDEALHDFRVALRRLRSTLRAHRELVAPDLGRKPRRRLKALARATGAARDAEVAQQVARHYAEHAPPDLDRDLQVRIDAAREEVRTRVLPEFARLLPWLRELLAWYRLAFRVGEPAVVQTFADRCAGLVREHGEALQRALAAIAGPDDAEHLHLARIEGKRLRYLLEPLRQDAAGAGALIERLRGLQDRLGEIRDRQLFAAAHAPSEAAARAALDAQAGYHAFAAAWDEPARAAFARELEALAESLVDPPFEVERKFLLDRLPALPPGAAVAGIEQGYIPGQRLHERLRRVCDAQGTRCWRTVKLGTGIRRIEVEEEAPPGLFEAMWPLTEGRRVVKRRHRVAEAGLVWEVDQFLDRDLVLAEVELPAADAPAPFPAWLAPHVVREVTDDPAFVNLNLAK